MKTDFDVAIVGAGIVGLAHAWRAAERGLRVVVLERSRSACGASVRNFGMIWPIGQPTGELHTLALHSSQLWSQLAESSGLWLDPCGSLHLAHRADELAVLEEYCHLTPSSERQPRMLTPAETLTRSAAANPEDLLGAMWSPTELCVNPSATLAMLPKWLQARYAVEFFTDTQIVAVEDRQAVASDGRRWRADRVLVCSGTDMQTLFPDSFRDVGLLVTKLQMLRTVPQPREWRMGPLLASGLTLRHYASFAVCPSLARLRKRIAQETPALDRFGVHVMAAQHETGQVVLGDSHEYGEEIDPFYRTEIEKLILRELRRQIRLPDWTIESRWSGSYVKHSARPLVRMEPTPGVHVCVSPGGAGMTLSFGWADQFWETVSPC